MPRRVEGEEMAQQNCLPKALPLKTGPGCPDSARLGIQTVCLLAQSPVSLSCLILLHPKP